MFKFTKNGKDINIWRKYMLISFILFGITSVFVILIMLILFSTLRIEIRNFEKNNYKNEIKKEQEYRMALKIYLFNKIKWFQIEIDTNRANKIKKGKILKTITRKIENIKKQKSGTIKKLIFQNKKQTIKYIKKFKIHISELNLSLDLGTESVILTSAIATFIASAISILMGKTVDYSSREKYKYLITPLYVNKNIFKIRLNCIINVKMVHIITILYAILIENSLINFFQNKQLSRTIIKRNLKQNAAVHFEKS
jgi:hypothetical protein